MNIIYTLLLLNSFFHINLIVSDEIDITPRHSPEESGPDGITILKDFNNTSHGIVQSGSSIDGRSLSIDDLSPINDSSMLDQSNVGYPPGVVPLFPEISYTHLWYADRPPRLGGQPFRMSISEVEKKFSFKYSETIYAQPGFQRGQYQAIYNTKLFQDLIRLRLEKPITDKLIICHINDHVGHGVFARQKIPFGTILALYTGVMQKPDKQETIDYEYVLNIGNSPFIIDPKRIGGIARFFQHLPNNLDAFASLLSRASQDPVATQRLKLLIGQTLSLEEAKSQVQNSSPKTKESMLKEIRKHSSPYSKSMSYEYDSLSFADLEMKDQVAWGNIEARDCILDGFPVVIFQAVRDIQPGEQIGFSYGSQYWTSDPPLLFTVSGEVFNMESYERN